MTELIKGGSFLISQTEPEQVYTPEDFNDFHKMVSDTIANFIKEKVMPVTDSIEKMEDGVTVGLMRQMGELGFLGSDIPEKFGGAEADKITSLIIAEQVSRGGSFSVAFGAHTGIGTLPILFFGNEEQKKRYLPGLASGQKVAAYALTEAEAGSDAMNAKTRAVLSEDGKHYILNGSKQFITNASWADVIVTYAKVDGQHFTAFIVDRDAPGVSIGAEEHKMGIKGSSTCSVIFEDAKVPVENLLGQVGKGHQVAFNILNIGRYKLGVGCSGAAKYAIELAARYAQERVQFNLPIAKFGLIKSKIADMNIRTYVTESICYRTGGLINSLVENLDMDAEDAGQKVAEGIQEYATECSIVKIIGSETLDFVADEAVQIHGGYGYSQEYAVERVYRDSRINRIFEGTNEINRLIIPATLLKKAQKGEIPLIQAAMKLQEELLMPSMQEESDELLGKEVQAIENLKKIFLLISGTAAQKYGEKLIKEQEILGRMADMVNEIFSAETAMLRAKKIAAAKGEDAAALAIKMTVCYVNELVPKFEAWAKEVVAAMEEGDARRTLFSILRKLTRYEQENVFALKREIADAVFKVNKYVVTA
ncbi:MAG: acyl-CoA dehydrogenase family protein [Dethiobacter sp.]|jgi:alkylation response protein AidB-like acyl-CoA dehydrogenase|nr:acyl-CoA dehydrogenase family protein [Dethiobacter sp.]MBS3983874.1 acyl-CoA dehydrogenase family protein [Dethiobacter sp.]MCL4462687.1 acyl-CoA dehydrogenase family protein [Bacillota bacterium]MCL5993806.1 acyl-CoA dehydrogenase family protein [Bacillota bacterium]